MTLVDLCRATNFEFLKQTTTCNDYNPQRVRRSLLGDRRWNCAVESTTSSVKVGPIRKESFSATRSSFSASIIFDLPTLFPNSLAQVSSYSSPELSRLPYAMLPFDSDFRQERSLFPKPAADELAERRSHHWSDQSRSKKNSNLASKPRPRTIRSFNARLNSFAQKGNYVEILALIEDVRNGSIQLSGPLNTYSFTILLKAYCNAGNLGAAWKLLDAMHSFDENRRPNRFTYNTLMNAFIRWEDMRGAADLFDLMERDQNESVRPDHVTYTTLMKGYAACGEHVSNEFETSYWIIGDMKSATDLFERLRHHPDPECRPNQVTYNTILKGFVAEGDMDAADRLLEQMFQDNDCIPDIVSMNTIIGGYARQGSLDRARQYFEQMPANGIVPNAVTIHAMIEGSVRNRNFDYAEKLFHSSISEKNSVALSPATYRVLIESWVRQGSLHKAEFVFRHQSLLSDPANHPNQATCMLLASAYSQAGKADQFVSVSTSRNPFESSPVTFELSKASSHPQVSRKRESIGSISSDDFSFKLNFAQ